MVVNAVDAAVGGTGPWLGAESEVSRLVVAQSERCLRAYEANPSLIEEHANIERSITQGGYGRRQLYELVQNGADELQGKPNGEIRVVLTADALYCANLGSPVSPEGAETILASHLSRKRGTEIGRFGLGFKSVLSVSASPQFFSRTGSFGWRADDARERIRRHVPAFDGPTPVLRLAHLLDAEGESRADPILHELMEWATTVVKLPLLAGKERLLANDLIRFPAKFVIFSPHVGVLILEDRRDPMRRTAREIFVRTDGDERVLQVDRDGVTAEESEWRVFDTVHTPSARARREAGEYHERARIPLAWAVPTAGGAAIGEFWAFFPTTWETTLRGVLNAPWKTNEDRQNLLKDNAFNEELMAEAAKLVVRAFPALSTADDPARHLTFITARGRESRNWADAMLTDLVYATAAHKPSVPDQDGRLRHPDEIKLHPEKLDKAWIARWAAYSGRPTDWCHPSVEEVTRRSRVEMIMQRARRGPATVRSWLEALVTDGTAEASGVALSIAADMKRQAHPAADEAARARILRTEDGRFVPPIPDTVFRRTELDAEVGDVVFADPCLVAEPAVAWALGVLGIREADAAGRFAAVVRQGFDGYGEDEWSRFWLLARAAGTESAIRTLREHEVPDNALRVRTLAGEYRSPGLCLLPGRVVRDGSEDRDVSVDLAFHRPDLGMLKELSVTDGPRVVAPDPQEEWYAQYREAAVRLYYKRLPSEVSRPADPNVVVEGKPTAGPLGLLPLLSEEARARFMEALPAAGLVPAWKVYARTRAHSDVREVVSPLVWLAKRYGRLPTSLGVRPVTQCLSSELSQYRHVLPIAQVDATLSATLRLVNDLDNIDAKVWGHYLSDVQTWEDEVRLGAFYSLAETQLDPPDDIRCRSQGDWHILPPDAIAAAATREQYQRLSAHDVPAVLADGVEAAGRLVDGWGLKPFDEALTIELRPAPIGEPVALEDLFPLLRNRPERPLHGLFLVHCLTLDELITTPGGLTTRTVEIGRGEDTIYYTGTDDGLELLKRLNELLGLGLSDENCARVISNRENARKNDMVVAVRRKTDDADRLSAMLDRSAIMQRLPPGLVNEIEAEEGPLDDRALCELALSVYGKSVLREYRAELEQTGFALPTQMAGGKQAIDFVTNLGFSREFAGSQVPSLDPMLAVSGPVDFPPLHEYQERMAERVADVLRSRPAKRGLLSLPTGAGKTRVTVEAVLRVLRTLPSGRTSIPVLWIAQTEELCEQAVQTWKLVWRSIGPAEQLSISRLWHTNSAQPVSAGFHLVVATDAKLDSVIRSPEYAWLREAQAVIVDEAHTSITPSYTRVFEALGLSQRQTRCPLIGLTATPFRGRNDVETERLVARYEANRLDFTADGAEILGENPYETLQRLGVLSRVRHKELRGADLALEPGEQDELRRMRRLPASAERRLGRDAERNRMLIDLVTDLDPTWPVLLYATSIDHARTLAALLRRKGVSAAPVDSRMDSGTRRTVIDDFRNKRIRVLTNYAVLSQGFDAPATRVVVVARPTYSPNVYQQMIGRGLRGHKNGGNDECLIVNVADNVLQYGEQLAFREFDYLWRQDAPAV